MERQERLHDEVEAKIAEYLRLGEKLVNPPSVKLVLISGKPDGTSISAESIAISTAKQCYAPGLAKMEERDGENDLSVGKRTLDAGHLTTRQHCTYTFRLGGLSRSVVHDVFNSYEYSNTEQQSQRYVEAQKGNYLVPNNLTESQSSFYIEACDLSNRAYFSLLEILRPCVEERVRMMYPSGGWRVSETSERLEDKIKKMTQEISRYVLPLGQITNLMYSESELSLIRKLIGSNVPNMTDEAKFVIGSMVNEVSKVDPKFVNELRKPVEVDESDYAEEYAELEEREEFDRKLEGQQSKLTDYTRSLNHSRIINGANKNLLANVFEPGLIDPITSRLKLLNLQYQTIASHAGDSQRQRQRTTFSTTPDISMLYDGVTDYRTPLVIRENPAVKTKYDLVMEQMFANVNKALLMGIPRDYALLLLPNALTVRVIEQGNLFNWIHRWKQRLCYLAQEEIFFISVDQVKQVIEKYPSSRSLIMAPCGLRKSVQVSPRCPEGKNWCGQPVYNWQIEEYAKHRLI